MDADGTKAGFDLAMTRAVTGAVHIPVIASGGCGSLEHFARVFEGDRLRRGAGGVPLPFRGADLEEVKGYLRGRGIRCADRIETRPGTE